MQKSVIIILGLIVFVGIGVFGWMYYNASSSLQEAEQQQNMVDQQQEVTIGSDQEQKQKNGVDSSMMESEEANMIQEQSEQAGSDGASMEQYQDLGEAVTMSPRLIEPGSSNVTITLSGVEGIVGFNIIMNAPADVTIDAYNDDLAPSQGNPEVYSQILNYISDDKDQAKISYVSTVLDNTELSERITFSLAVTNTGEEQAEISIDPESQMIGPGKKAYEVK